MPPPMALIKLYIFRTLGQAPTTVVCSGILLRCLVEKVRVVWSVVWTVADVTLPRKLLRQ